MTPLGLEILAKWRRKGKGVWHIKAIIDGHDKVFDLLYPGSLSYLFVSELARIELSGIHNVPLKHVAVTECKKESF